MFEFLKVDQDFTLLFGGDTSSMVLQKWDVFFKLNVIKEAKWLISTPELHCLGQLAERPQEVILMWQQVRQADGSLRKSFANDADERLVIFHKVIMILWLL